MPSRFSVRPVKTADLDAILTIEAASFGKEAYDRNLFAEYARLCGGMFLVANKGSKVIAYSITCIRGNRAELVSIAVAPDHRGSGAGSALLDSTLRRLRHRPVARLALTVKANNDPALAFYKKYGFRKLRRIPDYYEDATDGIYCVKLL
jgi:ribosomal-protein-alanine N-acetyltransferase